MGYINSRVGVGVESVLVGDGRSVIVDVVIAAVAVGGGGTG